MTRRFLVAHAPLRVPGEKKPRVVPTKVGALPWLMPEHALTVIVRATLPLGARGLEFLEPTPLSVGTEVDGVRIRPDDFVPVRGALDLVLVGSVEMAGRPAGKTWARRVDVTLSDATESFAIMSAAPGHVPLRPPYTRWLDGDAASLGPGPASFEWVDDGMHPEDFDYELYQAATPRLQFQGMPVGDPLVLGGLFAPGDRVETILPEIAPRLFVDPADEFEQPQDVVMKLDTLLVDCDRRVVDLTWRGFKAFPKEARTSVDRLVLAWVRPTEWDDDHVVEQWRQLMRDLPRGEFFWATEREDVVAGREPPPLDEDELAMARFASWDQVAAAEPTLDMEQRARIAAEVGEGREPRKDVLFRHGLDEHSWALEERATAEELSRPAASPEEAAQQRAYAEAFVRAQDALGRPEEEAITLPQFARLLALAEHALHEPYLKELEISAGAIFRLERRWSKAAEEDPAVRRELDETLEREREAAAELPRPELEGLEL